ncbi:uncharacterized protein BP01DRAFT_113211 [Aspergillus saccharolyticus JOP 1030-1]|uniref:Uncharacterized protein n=1 Tax=Aspergillus saccharolyticus JOP 1030-1 TaxID=1450539 RepID=A0A318ZPA4_9EURO|nr:hypothetical protein BP01DRAFT_113211 [Aspergillus saccharolyticus JOP 1030-1]PYH48817.1 hypothetical protein BP01DRAFT_113211 [Aspergillus saccharolyticus JOP 1030-1]
MIRGYSARGVDRMELDGYGFPKLKSCFGLEGGRPAGRGTSGRRRLRRGLRVCLSAFGLISPIQRLVTNVVNSFRGLPCASVLPSPVAIPFLTSLQSRERFQRISHAIPIWLICCGDIPS